MTLFTKNFIISLVLALVFFFSQPLQAATDLDGSGVKTKKTLKQASQKKKIKHSGTRTRKNKIKRSSPAKKKVASKPKRKKTASVPRPLRSDVIKIRSVESPAKAPAPLNGGSLQELVENEIIHLKNIGHLLPADQISLQVYDLNEKRMLADINGNVIRNAASLIKLFVMLAVYDSISRQEIQETPEIEHQLYRMIAISDNRATNSLIRRIGQGDALQGIIGINALTRKMGFSGSRLRELIPEGGRTYENQTSTADATLFFRLLYEQKLVGPQYSQKMNDILLKSIHDRIKTHQIRQDGVAVADKTGYVRGLNGDCGIVYLKGRDGGCNDYVLSVIIENKTRPSDGGWGKRKSAAIRYLSNRIYLSLRNGQSRG
jgi:beta-lactamase class A